MKTRRSKILSLTFFMITSPWALTQDSRIQTPKITETAANGTAEVQAGNVSIVLKRKDFDKVEFELVPKVLLEKGIALIPHDAPVHICIYLEDKRPLPAFEKGPRYFQPAYSLICVIPLTDSTVKDFKVAYPTIDEGAAKLRKLLVRRRLTSRPYRDMYDLPWNNAGPSVKAKIQYLDFRGSSGILFLTQYTQEMSPNPVNNEELTCNYQGLTKDAKYYIAARLAITHPSLPRGIDFTEQIERDNDQHYLRDEEKNLNSLADDSFQPTLTDLKSLLASISVK